MTRDGNRSAPAAPQGVYACAGEDDGWLAIAVQNDGQWNALRKVLGGPAWAAAPELAADDGRKAADDAVDAKLRSWTATRAASEAADELCDAGVPAAVVIPSRDVRSQPAAPTSWAVRDPAAPGDRRPRADPHSPSGSAGWITGSLGRRPHWASTTTRSSPTSGSVRKRSQPSAPRGSWANGRPVSDVSCALRTEDRHERDHLARITAEVVRQRELAVVAEPAVLGRLAPQLEPALEHHPQTRTRRRDDRSS